MRESRRVDDATEGPGHMDRVRRLLVIGSRSRENERDSLGYPDRRVSTTTWWGERLHAVCSGGPYLGGRSG